MVTRLLAPLVAALGILPIAARADDLLVVQERALQALGALRAQDALSVSVVGREEVGRTVSTFSVLMNLKREVRSGHPTWLLEARTAVNGVVRTRTVGDGVFFWHYWTASNTYSTSVYGDPNGGAQPAAALSRLLRRTTLRSTGAAGFVARLLEEVHDPVLRTEWRPWLPLATVRLEGDQVVCTAATPIPATLVYTFLPTTSTLGLPAWNLTQVDYLGETTVSGQVRRVSWTATIFAGQISEDANFQFVPPAGSRPVAGEAR